MSAVAEQLATETMTETTEFLAFVADDSTRATLAGVASGQGWAEENILSGGVNEAIAGLGEISTPNVLIVDLSTSVDVMSDVNRLAEVCDPGARVFVIGAVNDIQLYRDLISFGVTDYLVKPVSADDFKNALAQSDKPAEVVQSSETSNETGQVTAIIGAHGGVGSTTMAVNSAWLLAHEFGKQVALVDMDQHFGSVTLALDLEPGTGLSEALANPSRIDDLFIERAMVRESDNLMVLGSEEPIERGNGFKSDAFDVLVTKLRSKFEHIVVDLPLHIVVSHPDVLTFCDQVFVIADLSLAGLRDSKQLVSAIHLAAPTASVNIVINQEGRFKKAEVAAQDFEEGTGFKINFSVPFDAKGVTDAAIAGKALAEVGGKGLAIKAIRQMTEEIFDLVEPAKSGLFAKLMGK
tara:strand:- start:2860 stop:4083 length:1224 start_codon:yes stop_codon:yes gene_type:complete